MRLWDVLCITNRRRKMAEMIEMKERPILFSGEMVRAILASRKTQTRRIVKPQPHEDIDRLHGGKLRKRFPYQLEDDNGNPCGKGFQDENHNYWVCPYGHPGDRLWVRETWNQHPSCHGPVSYRATWDDDNPDDGWKPSIFMPRWASRITLEITGVRVERLQYISEADAMAEGIERVSRLGILRCAGWRDYSGETTGFMSPLKSYASLWQSIHGPDSWNANPRVWVIEFRKI